jgi:putative spermidine/putrescine transport system ATP-binding protein
MKHKIEIENLTAHYGDTVALRNVSITLEASKFITVLGPSGCGKTTLLRVLAGFADYDGRVLIDGARMDGVPPHKRGIGIVFQDYALFPHMTVEQNIGFGLRMRNCPANAKRDAVEKGVSLLRLKGLEGRYPHELSGGQQQRVALARAIAINPALLLLDEPLAALDKNLRDDMQVELRQLQQSLGITTMFVTHDQEEALALSDKVIVMNLGQVRQFGSPMEIYNSPVDRFVANFIGKSNIFSAQIVGEEAGFLVCRLPSGAVVKAPARCKPEPGTAIYVSIRPELLRLAPAGQPTTSSENRVEGVVEHATYLGHRSKIRVRLGDGARVDIDRPNSGSGQQASGWDIGQAVTLVWPPENTVVIGE